MACSPLVVWHDHIHKAEPRHKAPLERHMAGVHRKVDQDPSRMVEPSCRAEVEQSRRAEQREGYRSRGRVGGGVEPDIIQRVPPPPRMVGWGM